MKIPTIAPEFLSGLFRRDAAKGGLFVDDELPDPPDGVDPLYWRWSQGHLRTPDNPARVHLDQRTIADAEVRWRDGPG